TRSRVGRPARWTAPPAARISRSCSPRIVPSPSAPPSTCHAERGSARLRRRDHRVRRVRPGRARAAGADSFPSSASTGDQQSITSATRGAGEAGSVEIFEPPSVAAPRPAPPAAQPAPRPAMSASDRIYALWEGKQYAVVESEATAALARGGLSAGETARLWGLIGLARQEQGDVDGARGAREEAIMSAPAEDRAAWQRHMAQLALHAGQALLARVQVGSSDADERIDTLRAAIAWFESGITVGANDETLRDALRTARGALWPTYEEAANALLQRQEFHVARRLLQEAQADEDCPLPLQASFREMLAATFGGEVGQLTADAIRRMQEGKEEECLAALDRAETLLVTIPEEGIAPKRRQELERRLWWGYTKLGIRRVDGGMWEEAL